MRIFNLHDDVLNKLVESYKNNTIESFIKQHFSNLNHGNIVIDVFAYYFIEDVGIDKFIDICEILKHIERKYLSNYRCITYKADLMERKDSLSYIKAFEGLAPINDIKYLDYIYSNNFRVLSLCWNEENQIATGVKGNISRGLTDFGEKIVKRINEMDFILDVSHANEKTFDEILMLYKKPIIATHSNYNNVCDHPRNLSKRQMLLIKKSGGLIGVVTYKYFVSQITDMQNIAGFIKMINEMKNVVGIEHLALGFDFMDYFDSNDKFDNIFKNASELEHLESILIKADWSQSDINSFLFLNAYNFFLQWLPNEIKK